MMQQQIESQIQHVLVEFQIGDMKKSMSSAKANFLVAIGLMIATEYLGGLKTGTLGRHRWSKRKKKPQQSLAEFRFEGGFKYLGKPYAKLLKAHKNEVSDIYKNIRCGLVHEYLPKETEGVYAGRTGGPGVVQQGTQFVIMVDDYLHDLEQAANQLLTDIRNKKTVLTNCRRALARVDNLK